MKKWSLNAKFIFILSIFVATSIGIATLGLNRMGVLNEALNKLVDVVVARTIIVKTLDAQTNALRDLEKTFILSNAPEEMRAIGKELDDVVTDTRKNLDDFSALAEEAGKKQVASMHVLLTDWVRVDTEIRKHSLAGENKEAFALAMGKSREYLGKFDSELTAMIERNEKIMKEESERTDVLVENARNMILTASFLAILAGMALAFFTLRALNRAIDEVISNLTDSSTQVSSASQQIAASSEQLSSSSAEQASSLEETATALEEIQSMVQKNTENSRSTAATAGTSRDVAVKGKATVEDMIRAIGDIERSNGAIIRQVEDGNRQISEIVSVISEIGNKTKVINDIVFQTKLLSFNASVEAARAGEQGKGFAVVAEEVGNLAQMSGNAAKEITDMLDASIRKVETIVEETKSKVAGLMTTGLENVQKGTAIAQECGVALEEIVKNITDVSRSAEEISTASVEQAQGIAEINKAMSQLDQVTQQNAGSSEEAASAAEELSAQAESLSAVVQTLVVTVKGENFALANRGHVAPPRRASKPAAKAPAGKVVSLESRLPKKESAAVSTSELKKASGGYEGVPANEDPRFTDV